MSELITPDEAIEECLEVGAPGISIGLAKNLQAERNSLRDQVAALSAQNARFREVLGNAEAAMNLAYAHFDGTSLQLWANKLAIAAGNCGKALALPKLPSVSVAKKEKP